MSEPVWQSNYVDLCEESSVRFGAECVICAARYTTPIETIAPELVASAIPGSGVAQEIADLKYQRFTEFDAAFRELSITCYRCGRAACPDCWDDDNRMCAECVMSRGLTRSPRVGSPGRGPLQDGQLERVAVGRYSDVGRPAWVNHLLESEAARAGYVPPEQPPVARRNSVPVSLPQGPGALDPTASLVFAIPFAPADPGLLAAEPTVRVPTAGPKLSVPDDPMGRAIAQINPDGDEHFETNEGSATSNMVTCPRCGTANYDFVTRCTVCQLQLIQICPACEKLNAGHSWQCEFCGAAMRRPQGWEDVQSVITQVPPEEVPMKRRTAAPMSAPIPSARLTPALEPQPRARKTSAPRAVSTGAPALEAAAFAMPAMPSMPAGPAMPPFGLFEAPPPPQEHTHRSWSVMDLLASGVERLATLVLVAILLVVVGGIVAAEVSPKADAFITSLIHVDVRVTITHFLQQIQQLTQRGS